MQRTALRAAADAEGVREPYKVLHEVDVPRHRVAADQWQYHDRSSAEVRGTLLQLTQEFVLSARQLPGVTRIALLGSLVTSKARPKDADLLVSIAPTVELDRLARLARRLQGRAQGINSTADVFLATPDGEYLGRVCRHRECYHRRSCEARRCGARPHLRDDLDLIVLPDAVVASPPLVVHPAITAAITVPEDVVRLLLIPIGGAMPVASDTAGEAGRAL